MLQKPIKLENICRSWEKSNKRRAFNKTVGPGKKSKINRILFLGRDLRLRSKMNKKERMKYTIWCVAKNND